MPVCICKRIRNERVYYVYMCIHDCIRDVCGNGNCGILIPPVGFPYGNGNQIIETNGNGARMGIAHL